jgi:phage gp46-like protein
MKQDLLLKQGEGGLFDIQIAENDLQTVEGMETAVAVLLFTDARATPSEVVEPDKRRGWVGNIIADKELGGMLWLAEQVRNTQEVRNKIQTWASDSLQPLIDEGQASDINVTVTGNDGTRKIDLVIEIMVKKNQKRRFEYWLSTQLENLTNDN